MRISDWSSDVCSSDLPTFDSVPLVTVDEPVEGSGIVDVLDSPIEATSMMFSSRAAIGEGALKMMLSDASGSNDAVSFGDDSEDVETLPIPESIVEASFGSDVLEASSAFTPLEISDDSTEEHTSELHSLMR